MKKISAKSTRVKETTPRATTRTTRTKATAIKTTMPSAPAVAPLIAAAATKVAAKKKPVELFQFHILLTGCRVWRRFVVPSSYTMEKFHWAIQSVMGWKGYHMYQFCWMPDQQSLDTYTCVQRSMKNQFGLGFDDDEDDERTHELIASKVTLRDIYKDGLEKKFPLMYEYDMGDSWEHRIKLEKIFEDENAKDYPKCLAGSRACPPEDIGGIYGYKDFLKILENPKHKEYDETISWLNDCSYKKYDAKHFDPKEVKFRIL